MLKLEKNNKLKRGFEVFIKNCFGEGYLEIKRTISHKTSELGKLPEKKTAAKLVVLKKSMTLGGRNKKLNIRTFKGAKKTRDSIDRGNAKRKFLQKQQTLTESEEEGWSKTPRKPKSREKTASPFLPKQNTKRTQTFQKRNSFSKKRPSSKTKYPSKKESDETDMRKKSYFSSSQSPENQILNSFTILSKNNNHSKKKRNSIIGSFTCTNARRKSKFWTKLGSSRNINPCSMQKKSGHGPFQQSSFSPTGSSSSSFSNKLTRLSPQKRSPHNSPTNQSIKSHKSATRPKSRITNKLSEPENSESPSRNGALIPPLFIPTPYTAEKTPSKELQKTKELSEAKNSLAHAHSDNKKEEKKGINRKGEKLQDSKQSKRKEEENCSLIVSFRKHPGEQNTTPTKTFLKRGKGDQLKQSIEKKNMKPKEDSSKNINQKSRIKELNKANGERKERMLNILGNF